MRIAKGSLVKLICIGLVLILALCALPFTFSWLCDSLRTIPAFTSYVHKSYFESGDGTAAKQFQIYDSTGAAIDPETGDPITPASSEDGCAFEIKYPVQLYYFAWLQYLGYFNQPKEGAGAEIDQVYFYLSSDLDMTGWTLPPIGTELYPFVGNFDGNGHTISNLTIQNVETGHDSSPTTLNDFPIADNDDFTGVDIIGFFGVVGAINDNGMVYAATDHTSDMFDHSDSESYTYSSQINEIKNFALDSVTVKTETTRSLIGIVAGYVNGEVSQVRVGTSGNVIKTGNNVSAVNTLTDNLSDYTLMGYVTDPYKDTSDVVLVKLDTPLNEADMSFNYQSQGSTAGWGGSIDMYGLLKRLDAVRRITESSDNLRDRQTILRTELIVIDPLTGNEETTVRQYYDSDSFRGDNNNTFTVNGNNKLYYFATLEAGSYHVIPYDDGNRHRNYLIGLNTMFNANTVQQGKTVYTVTFKTSGGEYVYLDAYDYSSGANYLNLNNNQDGLTGGNTARYHWTIDENGYLFTYNDLYDKIYLNATNTISISNTGSTVWKFENNRLSYKYNGLSYVLHYNGGWTVTQEYYYVISDGNGNYLRYYNTALQNTTNIANASHWTFSNEDTLSGYISLEGTNTYLRYNNGLTTYTGNAYTTNATSWNNDGTSLYSGSNYILFNGSTWVARPLNTYYTIHNGSDYLNITAVNGNTATIGTGDSISDITSDNHTLWTFSNTAGYPQGTISATVNGTTFYLRNNSGTLTATNANNPTSWSNSGSDLFAGIDYIIYDGNWHIVSLKHSIHSGSNYLNVVSINGATASLGTGNDTITDDRESDHTMWTIDSNGYIFTYYNGTAYYLRNNNGTLTATTSTTNRTVWMNNGTSLLTGNEESGYYLQFDNGWSLLQRVLRGYTIDYSGNYLNLTSTDTGVNNPFNGGTVLSDNNYNNHTIWTFETTGTYPSGRISTVANGTRYYLYVYRTGNMGNRQYYVRLTTSTSQTYSQWSNNNGQLYIYYGGNRYIRFNNNAWLLNTSSQALNFHPVYSFEEAPVVTVDDSYEPIIIISSELEPAPYTQPEKIDNGNGNLSRTQVTGLKDFTKSSEMKPSGIPVYIPITPTGTAEDFIAYRAGGDTNIFNVAAGNTGYITSGAYDLSDNRRGDVRLSAYNITSIDNCYTPANGFTRVYTIDGSGPNNYNKRQINLTTGKCDATGVQYVRFLDSKAQLTETLQKTNSADQSVYGIHFMDAVIGMDHIITAPYAVVDGTVYDEGYDLPEVAIDFSVHQKGYITFYAGAYHSSNDSLFSLHEIKRNGNVIEDIKEIQYIYTTGVQKDPYIYMYKDKTFSDGESHPTNGSGFTVDGKEYSLIFNCEWIWTNPGFVRASQHDVYYFEIPVNRGEYALGSVDGGTGAYLIYLDIAANSQLVDRATVIENFEEVTRTYEFPVGATFQNTDFPADFEGVVIPSAVASLTTSAASSNVTVTDDQQTGMTTVNFTTGTIGYVKEGVVANGLTYDSTSLTPVAPTPITKKIRRTTYYDYNVALERYTVTEVLVWQINNGDKQMTINAWNTDSDWDIYSSNADKIATMTAEEAFVPLPNANVENVVINTDVSNTFERVVPEGAAANSSEHYFLIRVDSAADAQTLRINPDAFEGDLEIAEELYSFSFGIRDYDDSDNGAKIVYVLSADVFTFDSNLESDWYTISGFSYDVKVETYETIEIHEIEDNSSSIDVDVTVTVVEPESNVVEP